MRCQQAKIAERGLLGRPPSKGRFEGENGPMWTCPKCRSVMKDSRVICGSCGALVRPGAMVFMSLIFASIAFLAVSIALFPDAPISQVGAKYVGKGGHPHTAEDYRRFQEWEPICHVTGIVVGLSAFYAVAEYYLLTGSLKRQTDKGTEVWRKPQGRRDDS
jgi:hypothetical protein